MTMKNAIQCAIRGGYDDTKHDGAFVSIDEAFGFCVLDQSFWKCLGKELGWDKKYLADYGVRTDLFFLGHAMEFHEKNLTEGWSKAMEYLESLISSHREGKK